MKIKPNIRFNMNIEDKIKYLSQLGDLLYDKKGLSKKSKKLINNKIIELVESIK